MCAAKLWKFSRELRRFFLLRVTDMASSHNIHVDLLDRLVIIRRETFGPAQMIRVYKPVAIKRLEVSSLEASATSLICRSGVRSHFDNYVAHLLSIRALKVHYQVASKILV